MQPSICGRQFRRLEHTWRLLCQTTTEEDIFVNKFFYATFVFVMLFLAATVYSQDRAQRPSKAPDEAAAGPHSGAPMAGMMSYEGMGMMHREGMPMSRREGMMMRRNPHLAGIMMQMRGEMMRIRGEAMMKQGDVLRSYGERLEKENAIQQAPDRRPR
jgi:hypothetical protein